jgi:hypothetical protein
MKRNAQQIRRRRGKASHAQAIPMLEEIIHHKGGIARPEMQVYDVANSNIDSSRGKRIAEVTEAAIT